MVDDTLPRLIFIRICIFLLHYAPLIETVLLLTVVTLRYPPPTLIPHAEQIASFIPPPLYNTFTSPTTILLLAALLTTEFIYITTLYLPHKASLKHEAVHPPLPPRKEREELFDRALDSTTDWDEYLKLWFLGSPVEEVKRENVREFLLWAFFDRDGEAKGDNDDIAEELESYLVKIEALLGRKLPPGRGSATSLRLTFDEIETRYRSVVWYGVIALLDLITHAVLAWGGYRHYRPGRPGRERSLWEGRERGGAEGVKGASATTGGAVTAKATTATLFPPRLQHSIPLIPPSFRHHTSPTKHLSYYLRPHRSRTQPPMVFIHGIGIGLWSYLPLLNSLKISASEGLGGGKDEEDGQIGILAVELLPISSRLTGSGPELPAALDHEQFLREFEAVLKFHSTEEGDGRFPLDKGFTLVTHSYGSTLVAPILRSTTQFTSSSSADTDAETGTGQSLSLASLTNTLILTDPVSICLHLPTVAYNFTRRAPRTANEWQLWYFASTDIGIARALGRGFFWRRNILWREDINEFLLKGKGEGVGERKKERRRRRRVVVCLAGKDLIVDTKSVRAYLGWTTDYKGWLDEGVEWLGGKGKKGQIMRKQTGKNGSGIEVLWYPRLDHAQMFENEETLRPVLDVIGGWDQRGDGGGQEK
ncbi:hypothetical protein SMACR_07461 [Sordaria macrospora]|uniref:WGS project CABT00000000 data, contig 2.46 n=2 Tax=Sordaria macrospora TaxID=5147 RepID=F7W8N9_SORMK|nr:uncharacterized protein SMAC_07461 [Sordaria macrospora k-hell]KAA8628522.1 hypothetical protein SMACR_07461 [Sordaria macrospora]KAH7627975.1 hypothetical protein B0T09DRAFT_410852 [Sordaria sp. MPI-SDFR-AT-0083]WPJ65428.1 hypothetical protein SMAC4_07461 [Sordaria macrospora]CCC13825.1 unnamed protein product [Sordaria macrospora k-hell]